MSTQKSTPHKRASRFTIPKKRFIEIAIVCLTLGVIMWLTTLITPYQPKTQTNFYAADEASVPTHNRAKVIELRGDSLVVELLDGERSHQKVTVPYEKSTRSTAPQPNSIVILNNDTASRTFFYIDTFRIPGLIFILSLFVLLVLIVGRRRGFTSLIGLGVSVIVVGWFIIPLILSGFNALWVSIAGAYIIAFSSILIAHGRKARTFISIVCVSIILLIVAVASQASVTFLSLSGLSDEASNYLAVAKPHIDMAGILAGGIIIASLGVLDDIVTAQVATVDELQKANTKLTVRELYTRASSVGGEHIASLVNTLALVYVGAALPVIISLVSYTTDVMLLFNSEYITTEIIRTVIASAGLVLAVPVSTIVAATILHRRHIQRQSVST